MKTTIKTLIVCMLIVITACTSDTKTLFKSDVIIKDGKKTLNHSSMEFKDLPDSIMMIAMSIEDKTTAMGAIIKRGETIYETEDFMVKPILRIYPNIKEIKLEILLRNYSYDLKIIDDMVLSSTVDPIPFSGKFNEDLTFEITDENGDTKTGKLNEQGRFINDNNE